MREIKHDEGELLRTLKRRTIIWHEADHSTMRTDDGGMTWRAAGAWSPRSWWRRFLLWRWHGL